ncbi:MAG TPA: hypothetical protein VL993_07510, partial [Stellaceae bacterium]|nr:hypothetical protein [Stellaceae bacterium]
SCLNSTTTHNDAWQPPNGTDLSQIHAYGMLWCGANSRGSVCNGTPQVCFYFDGTQEYCADTTSDNEAQSMLLYAYELEQCGTDLNNSSCLGGVTDIHFRIYSMRYWSCGSWQSNALAC